jgi:hypothetical protein
MGWITDVINNSDFSGAQNWINQQKEESWAAEKEEERRKDRVNASEGVSYDPAPAQTAKEAIAQSKEKIKETVTGGTGRTEGQQSGSKGADTSGSLADKIGKVKQNTVSYTPEPEPEPEQTSTPIPAAAEEEPQVYAPEPGTQVSAGERRAEQQSPVLSSAEETPENPKSENGKITSRSKGEPVVYTGGTAGTIGMKRNTAQSIAAQTKAEFTEEDDDSTILAKYWAMSPEEQAEQVGNPRVQAALRAQANQQAAGNRGNGYLPTNPLYSEGFSTRGEYDPRATQYSFNGQMREVGVENNRPYDRPLYPAQQNNDQRAAEYLAAWQRRNADIQQQRALQNYQYDPLQAAILRANAGLGGSGTETRGYDPGIRLANDQQYLADNGFSWAGNPSMQSENRGGTYVPPTAEGQEDYDTQVRILKDRGYSQEDAERMAAEEFGNYTYSGDQPSYVRRDVPMVNADSGPARQGYYLEGFQQAIEQGMNEADAMQYGENYATAKMNQLQKAGQMTDAERARRNPNASYYYEPVAGTGTGRKYYSGADRAEAQAPKEPATTPAQTPATTPTTGGQGTGTNRPGADAAITDIMGGSNSREPDSVRFAREAAERRNAGTGTRTGTGAGTNKAAVNQNAGSATKAGTTTKSGTGSGTDIPKGSMTFKPTYGQGGDVVKAPYRKGGYSEEELIAMGNNAYGKKSGNNVYEGYYEWNGKYYPVDQVKANYYKANRNSYKGWEEPMREYYNNFGTFYGYRPDWKTAGGVNVWKQNRQPAGRSYGGGGSTVNNNQQRLRLSGYSGGSGGSTNYGRGSTANNGIYWNGNTSWSI